MQDTSKKILDLSGLIVNQDLFQILQIIEEGGNIYISLCCACRSASCTLCGKPSLIIRSYYTRMVQDLPILGRRVVVQYTVRRFRCDNETCVRKIFSEQCPDFIAPYSRRTYRATQYLEKILIEMSANKGTYISRLTKIPVSSSTCLRIVKKMPVEISDNLEVIGIDDWAKRKGVHYGSIIVNIKNGRAIDMIDSRDPEMVSLQLARYRKANYVTRDRSSSYASSIRTAIPSAKQIADKFHLLQNLSDHIYKEIRRSYKRIREEYLSGIQDRPVSDEETIITGIDRNTGPYYHPADNINKRKAALAADINKLSGQGLSIRGISRLLNIARNTVRHVLREEQCPGKRDGYINNYSAYISIIITKIKEGYNIKQIYNYIADMGFSGKMTTFYDWFKNNIRGYDYYPSRQAKKTNTDISVQQILWHGLSPRKLALTTTSSTWGIHKKTGECSKDRHLSQNVLAQSSLLQLMQAAYTSFRNILHSKQPNLLTGWISAYDNSTVKCIQSFIRGVKQDLPAVENAIRYPWTNSIVEGNVNRLKNKKREMYGRAGFELLKRKVILSATG